MMDVRFLAEIRDDLLSAMDWFDRRRAGLGEELESEFYTAVARVCEWPQAFAPDRTGYRPCRLKRFTAVLYFRIEGDFIIVAGLFVGGRDESSLQGRE